MIVTDVSVNVGHDMSRQCFVAKVPPAVLEQERKRQTDERKILRQEFESDTTDEMAAAASSLRNQAGELFLLSNELDPANRNLSFENWHLTSVRISKCSCHKSLLRDEVSYSRFTHLSAHDGGVLHRNSFELHEDNCL